MSENLLSDDISKVERRIQNSLLDGEVIVIENGKEKHQFRLAKRGQSFEDGDFTFEPIETGVFKRYTTEDGDPRWIHYGRLDDISFVMDIVTELPPMEREAFFVGLSANAVLRKKYKR